MVDAKTIDLDQLRREFAQRIDGLVVAEEGAKKLEKFSQDTGIALRQISQWRNPRHINWPSVRNLVQIAVTKGISLNWLLLNVGDKQLSARELKSLTAGRIIAHAADKIAGRQR